MEKELRTERLTLQITLRELYFISRKARALGMSRPNLVIEAVTKYQKDGEELITPEQLLTDLN